VRIDGLIVILKVLSSTGAGCLIYILFPIPAIRFSHRDTSTLPLDGNHRRGCQRPSITVVKGPVKTFKKKKLSKGKEGKGTRAA
jgi:hypothetical protein